MKHRSIVLTAAAVGVAVLGLAAFGLNQLLTPSSISLFGESSAAIPLEKTADFETPVTLRVPELKGWQSSGTSSTTNPILRCNYMVNDESSAESSDNPSPDSIPATGKLLAQVRKELAGSLPGPKSMGTAENVVIPQKSTSEPGLEFKVARMDYLVPGTAMSGTVRIAARDMPEADSALLVYLMCPTSVVENDSDPWSELVSNTVMVADEKAEPAATEPSLP